MPALQSRSEFLLATLCLLSELSVAMLCRVEVIDRGFTVPAQFRRSDEHREQKLCKPRSLSFLQSL